MADSTTLRDCTTRTKDLARRHQSGAQECAASDLLRRIGVLVNFPADDPQAQVRNAALLQGLQELGWTVGRNLRIDFRWGAANADGSKMAALQNPSQSNP